MWMGNQIDCFRHIQEIRSSSKWRKRPNRKCLHVINALRTKWEWDKTYLESLQHKTMQVNMQKERKCNPINDHWCTLSKDVASCIQTHWLWFYVDKLNCSSHRNLDMWIRGGQCYLIWCTAAFIAQLQLLSAYRSSFPTSRATAAYFDAICTAVRTSNIGYRCDFIHIHLNGHEVAMTSSVEWLYMELHAFFGFWTH